MAIISNLRAVAKFGPIGRCVDFDVLRLRGAECVEIDRLIDIKRLERRTLFGFGKARIEKAAAILDPGKARKRDVLCYGRSMRSLLRSLIPHGSIYR